MTVHPEDALAYAEQLHSDLDDLTAAVERVAAALAQVVDAERGTIRVSGVVVTREDRP
jgi:hypothetical protein